MLWEVSTKLRHGVGLNELLGAMEPEKNETPATGPKDRSRENRVRPKHSTRSLKCAADTTTHAIAPSRKPSLSAHRTATEEQRAEKHAEEHCKRSR